MKNKTFYDEQHARTYLIGGIIRFNGKPIFIRDLQGAEGPQDEKKFKIVYSRVGGNNNSILFLPNNKIDMLPVPLGMMDTEEETWYVQRNPSRGWKIGLNPDNIAYQIISGQKQRGGGMGGAPRPSMHFNSKFLHDCIMGVHPTYKQALKTVTDGSRFSTAFSRQFAVNRGGLVFKSIDDTVGICERNKPVLFDHFQYLTEVLEEDLQ